MSLDSSLNGLMFDTVTIEPFSSETAARAVTYGTAVTYNAQVTRGFSRVTNREGREVTSTVQVVIPNRVNIDSRSRITLPSDFVPRTPPIQTVETFKGLGLDHTVVYL